MNKTLLWKSNYLKLSLNINWDALRMIRGFVDFFIDSSVVNDHLNKRVAMVSHELLENAIKYSISHEVHLEVFLSHKENNDEVIKVLVKNQAKTDKLPELKKTLKEIKHGDPIEMYMDKMRNIIKSTNDSSHHLGLARIRCEGRANIKEEYHDNNWVSISAFLQY